MTVTSAATPSSPRRTFHGVCKQARWQTIREKPLFLPGEEDWDLGPFRGRGVCRCTSRLVGFGVHSGRNPWILARSVILWSCWLLSSHPLVWSQVKVPRAFHGWLSPTSKAQCLGLTRTLHKSKGEASAGRDVPSPVRVAGCLPPNGSSRLPPGNLGQFGESLVKGHPQPKPGAREVRGGVHSPSWSGGSSELSSEAWAQAQITAPGDGRPAPLLCTQSPCARRQVSARVKH